MCFWPLSTVPEPQYMFRWVFCSTSTILNRCWPYHASWCIPNCCYSFLHTFPFDYSLPFSNFRLHSSAFCLSSTFFSQFDYFRPHLSVFYIFFSQLHLSTMIFTLFLWPWMTVMRNRLIGPLSSFSLLQDYPQDSLGRYSPFILKPSISPTKHHLNLTTRHFFLSLRWFFIQLFLDLFTTTPTPSSTSYPATTPLSMMFSRNSHNQSVITMSSPSSFTYLLRSTVSLFETKSYSVLPCSPLFPFHSGTIQPISPSFWVLRNPPSFFLGTMKPATFPLGYYETHYSFIWGLWTHYLFGY